MEERSHLCSDDKELDTGARSGSRTPGSSLRRRKGESPDRPDMRGGIRADSLENNQLASVRNDDALFVFIRK